MKLKHQRPVPEGKKDKKGHQFALRWHGMVSVDEGHKLLERIVDLPVLHVHSSIPVTNLTVRIE